MRQDLVGVGLEEAFLVGADLLDVELVEPGVAVATDRLLIVSLIVAFAAFLPHGGATQSVRSV